MIYPSPIKLLDEKRSGKTITIGLPGRRHMTISAFVRAWRNLLKVPPDTEINGWEWYPVTAAEILRKISCGVHDRINQHLPWKVPASLPGRECGKVRVKLVALHAQGVLSCQCRWCGRDLLRYENKATRFCDAPCRNSYHL